MGEGSASDLSDKLRGLYSLGLSVFMATSVTIIVGMWPLN